jgi:hypothetical protein
MPSPELVNCQTDCLPGRVPVKQRAHEGPFVPEYAAALVPDPVRFDEVPAQPMQMSRPRSASESSASPELHGGGMPPGRLALTRW